MSDPTFGELGTLYYSGVGDVSSMATTIENVASGDIILVFVQRDHQPDCTGIAAGSLTFTKLESADSQMSAYLLSEIWGAIATEAVSSMEITASYSSTDNWGSIHSSRYSPGGVTSITPQKSSAHTALQTTSTNRTVPDITTTTRTLLIVGGCNWDYYYGSTAATNWTKRVDSQTHGTDSTTMFYFDRVAASGTYPDGNFATVSDTDRYIAYIVALEISTPATLEISVHDCADAAEALH